MNLLGRIFKCNKFIHFVCSRRRRSLSAILLWEFCTSTHLVYIFIFDAHIFKKNFFFVFMKNDKCYIVALASAWRISCILHIPKLRAGNLKLLFFHPTDAINWKLNLRLNVFNLLLIFCWLPAFIISIYGACTFFFDQRAMHDS